MLQAHGIMLVLNHNIRSIPMPASQLSISLFLSTFSRETAEALQTFAAFLGEGAERGGPEAFADFEVGLHKRRGRAATHVWRHGCVRSKLFGSKRSLVK